jgi:hypothetical protein
MGLLVLISGFVLSSGLQAETLSQIQIFERCYIRMVHAVPNTADPIYKSVESGKSTGAAGCLALFDKARFNSSGVLVNRMDPAAKSILRTFQDLHFSWFQSKPNPVFAGTYLIHDTEETALYYTRAAFLPSTRIDSVLTLNMGLRGIRDQASYPHEQNDFEAQRILKYGLLFPYANETDLLVSYINFELKDKRRIITLKRDVIPGSTIVEVGELAGVAPARSYRLPSLLVNTVSADLNTIIADKQSGFELNEHFGGGILGSQSFIQSNVNLGLRQIPDGYKHINRRLSLRIFEDLLCHRMPTLRVADVQNEVDSRSEFTFQRNVTCMQCHSGIDGLAFGYRNHIQFFSSGGATLGRQEQGVPVSGITRVPASAGASLFPAQIPNGRLHYRELISGAVERDLSFTSIKQLGAMLASENDFYTCAAKRYYQFFTGVDVDLSQPAKATLDKYHQGQVVALAKVLHTKQSVRELLKAIFASDTFKSSNFLTEK